MSCSILIDCASRVCVQHDVDAAFLTTKVLPMALFSAITLYTGQRPYLTLSVSFIQMLKAMSPLVTYALLYLHSLERYKHTTITMTTTTTTTTPTPAAEAAAGSNASNCTRVEPRQVETECVGTMGGPR